MMTTDYGRSLRDGLSSSTEPEVSALRASIPSAWFAWPVQSDWQEVEVELLMREGTTFRTNANDFEYWFHRAGSDTCDDIIAFRIVGQLAVTEAQLHRKAAEWQRRHFVPFEATFGDVDTASGMSAGTAETTQIGSGPQDRQPDGEAGTPKGHPEQPR